MKIFFNFICLSLLLLCGSPDVMCKPHTETEISTIENSTGGVFLPLSFSPSFEFCASEAPTFTSTLTSHTLENVQGNVALNLGQVTTSYIPTPYLIRPHINRESMRERSMCNLSKLPYLPHNYPLSTQNPIFVSKCEPLCTGRQVPKNV